METPYSLAPRGCAVCSSKHDLLRCGSCLVVCYCGRAHQVAHRNDHKTACAAIRKTRQELHDEEARLRARPADMFLPADVFNTCVGNFWGILDTRDYMRARHAAADALLKINNVDAVKAALAHFVDMIRLCRSDNLGVRDVVPFLMLRLGQEQECYDFLKWWVTTGTKNHEDAPYLEIKNADAFEDVDVFCQGVELAHMVAITLLKTRLYLDLSACEPDIFTDPPVITSAIGELVQNRIRGGLDIEDIQSVAEALEGQYRGLCGAVHDQNPHFWDRLREAEGPITRPAMFTVGSPEEAELVLYHSKRAWDESEDAAMMIDFETSTHTAVYRSPPDPSRISLYAQANSTRSPSSRVRVLMLCLENDSYHEGLLSGVYGSLISRLNSEALVQRETSVQGALSKLDQSPPPSIILIADEGIARQRKVWERVIDRLRAGATVILAVLFSSMISPAGLTRMFAMIGLPWTRSDYTRETVKLRPNSRIDRSAAARLSAKYSQKGLFLRGVQEPDILYARDRGDGGSAGEAAVVFAKVEQGKLGYVGDVNGEKGSEAVVMAMCGI